MARSLYTGISCLKSIHHTWRLILIIREIFMGKNWGVLNNLFIQRIQSRRVSNYACTDGNFKVQMKNFLSIPNVRLWARCFIQCLFSIFSPWLQFHCYFFKTCTWVLHIIIITFTTSAAGARCCWFHDRQRRTNSNFVSKFSSWILLFSFFFISGLYTREVKVVYHIVMWHPTP